MKNLLEQKITPSSTEQEIPAKVLSESRQQELRSKFAEGLMPEFEELQEIVAHYRAIREKTWKEVQAANANKPTRKKKLSLQQEKDLLDNI